MLRMMWSRRIRMMKPGIRGSLRLYAERGVETCVVCLTPGQRQPIAAALATIRNSQL